MTRSLAAFVALTIATAIGLGLTLPSRLVRYVDKLVVGGRLYQLNPDERTQLCKVMENAARMGGIDKPISINEEFRSDHLNVYILRAKGSPEEAIAQGNAAFSLRDDILLIDGSYFLLGNEKVLAPNADLAAEKIFRTLRVYAYFVLLHELGHRSTRTSWKDLNYSSFHSDKDLERRADEFAIRTLLNLYEIDASSPQNVPKIMPGPVSVFIDFSGEKVGPGCRLADHLSHAFAFLSEAVLDNAFPLLSASTTHPAFLTRILEILKAVGELPDVQANEDARRTLSLTTGVVASAQNLMDRRPTEISFDSPIEYAFLDGDSLYYFETGAIAPQGIRLAQLKPNASLKVRNHQKKNNQAPIQYSWINADGNILIIRRNGDLSVTDKSGKLISKTSLTGKLGDQSCVLEMLVPTVPTRFAYILYCEHGDLCAKIIDNGVLRNGVSLVSVASSLIPNTYPDPMQVIQMTTSFQNSVGLYAKSGNQIYLVEATSDLSPLRAYKVVDAPPSVNVDVDYRGRRLPFKVYLYGPHGKTYFFEGTGLFRNFSMRRVDDDTAVTVGHYAMLDRVDEPRMSEVLLIKDYRYISKSEAIVNLVDTGVYIVNFESGQILPISHHYFTNKEQLTANTAGDWLLYRKYGDRVLFFPHTGGKR